MEVPYKPLCREACKGLCHGVRSGPECRPSAAATAADVNLKMSALQKIKIEK